MTLCHSHVLGTVLLFLERWGDLVCHIYDTTYMCEIMVLPVKFYTPFPKIRVPFLSPLGVVDYSHDCMLNNKDSAII